MRQSWRAMFGTLIRFGFVGALGTLLYAGLAFALEGAGAPLYWAHAVASAISLIASYLGQKVVTFGIRGQHRKMGVRFILATAMLVSIQSALVVFLSRSGLAPQLILLASTFFYPPASFLMHTFWTFRSKQSNTP